MADIPAEFSTWLASNFDNPVWKTIALRCHGCGACASVCPTCHCFDIVDEHISVNEGVRRRNWDSCQTGQFTLHASGHNPRQSQSTSSPSIPAASERFSAPAADAAPGAVRAAWIFPRSSASS
jgi:ferredoxin